MAITADPFRRLLADAPTTRDFSDALTRPGADAEEVSTVAMVLDAVRTWGARAIDPAAVDAAGAIPPAIRQGARELGLYGLTIPQEYGGAGLSMKAASRVTEELALFDRSVAVSIGLHNGLGVRGLVQHGSEELKARYLPGLAAGDLIAAFAATEPGAGSDIAAVTSIARPAEANEGDPEGTLRLSGQKVYVTNGGFADTFTVIARTPGLGGVKRGHSVFLVTRDLPGVTVGREEHKLGIKGSSTTTLDLEDVPVGLDRVIGTPGRGMELLNEVLAWGRTLMASGCLGAARAACRLAAEYSQTRRQFGRPLAEFGLVQEKLAAMRARIYAMESLLRQATQVLDVLGADIALESTVAKVFNSEGAWAVADDALQLHGGIGFIEETGVARILRDVRITRIFEGANDVLRAHLATAALAGAVQLGDAPTLTGHLSASLAAEADRFDGLYRQTLGALEATRKRLGMKVFQRQLVLGGVADALIPLYTLLAVLLRTDGEVRARGPERAAQELRLARWLTARLGRAVEEGLQAAQRDDEHDLARAISEAEVAQFA
jgi:alkylation response protein AidB-like acyl-CoA dehydrogenase